MNNEVGLVCYLLVALLVSSNLWFFFRVLRPLKRLALQSEHIRQGDFDALERDCGGIPEIRELRRAMAGMVGHVRRTQQQSRAYADRLADAQESERKRVAHELHDETLQTLIAINQSIDLARQWMQSDSVRTGSILQSAREQVVETVKALRNLIGGLRPPALEELGLAAAVEMEATKGSDPSVQVRIVGIQRRLEETQELTLFRVAQEALINARRHSHAQQIELCLDYQTAGIRLHVHDDGRGFQVPPHLIDLVSDKHYGLLGIQERIESFGGTLQILSGHERGTTIDVFLPSAPSQQPDHMVIDPVCFAHIQPRQAYASQEYKEQIYYFCCPVCQGAFKSNPELYLHK
ncbi:MAG: YHS domain-containing protein [Chloroflexi bacterium]|nr:YHS domain-containing protein [Chloroflexota bacterium]